MKPKDLPEALELSIKRYDKNRIEDGYDKWTPGDTAKKAYKPKIKPYIEKKLAKMGKFAADSKYIEHSKYLSKENLIRPSSVRKT